MESVPLEMDDIFGDGGDIEEDNYPGPLPDLPAELEPTQNRQDDTQDAENDAVLSKLQGMKGAAKKVKRNIPKLDSRRLTGERGIPILPKIFQDVKFKGKGHEMQDLKVIMDKLEHWGHRLFPKMPFDEILQRVEKLGAKNETKTCIKKIRQDIPILDADFIAGAADAENVEEGETVNNENDTVAQPAQNDGEDRDAEEAFDEMMRQESSQRPSVTQTVLSSPSKTNKSLSEEQRELIERNKRLAMEKRLARLGQKPSASQQPSSSQQPASSQQDGTTSSQPIDELNSSQIKPQNNRNRYMSDSEDDSDGDLMSFFADERKKKANNTESGTDRGVETPEDKMADSADIKDDADLENCDVSGDSSQLSETLILEQSNTLEHPINKEVVLNQSNTSEQSINNEVVLDQSNTSEQPINKEVEVEANQFNNNDIPNSAIDPVVTNGESKTKSQECVEAIGLDNKLNFTENCAMDTEENKSSAENVKNVSQADSDKNQNGVLDMETDEQQTTEEILNDLEDL